MLPGYCDSLKRCVCIAKHLLQEAAPGSQVQILRAFTHWLGHWRAIPFSVTDSSAVVLSHGLGITGVSRYYVIAPKWRQHPLRTQLLNLQVTGPKEGSHNWWKKKPSNSKGFLNMRDDQRWIQIRRVLNMRCLWLHSPLFLLRVSLQPWF